MANQPIAALRLISFASKHKSSKYFIHPNCWLVDWDMDSVDSVIVFWNIFLNYTHCQPRQKCMNLIRKHGYFFLTNYDMDELFC